MLAAVIYGCDKAPDGGSAGPAIQGVIVGPAEVNEEGDVVHNVVNTRDVEQKVLIATICYGKDGEPIDDSDRYEVTLQKEEIIGWAPVCPPHSVRYDIKVEEKK